MSRLNLIQHDELLCHDSVFNHVTYCREYDSKDKCQHICYYARKMDFLKQSLDNSEVECLVEQVCNMGVGKYGEN